MVDTVQRLSIASGSKLVHVEHLKEAISLPSSPTVNTSQSALRAGDGNSCPKPRLEDAATIFASGQRPSVNRPRPACSPQAVHQAAAGGPTRPAPDSASNSWLDWPTAARFLKLQRV